MTRRASLPCRRGLRLRLGAVVALAWAAAGGAPARGEESPGLRLEGEWPEASDDARRALLAAVVGSASPASFDAVRRTAEVSAGMAAEAALLRRTLAERDAGAGAAAGDAKPAGDGDLGGVEARETRALRELAAGAATILRALPAKDFATAARGALERTAATGVPEPFRAWAGDAVGLSARPDTLPLLLAVAGDRLSDIRRAQAARTAPAKKLEEVNAKIADALERHLKAAYARGDYRPRVPAGLLGELPKQKDRLEAEVLEHQEAIDEAEVRRLAARRGVEALLSALPAPEAEAALVLLEREHLGSSDVDVRAFGLAAVARAGGDRALGHLRRALSDADARVAASAAAALGERGDAPAVEALAAALADGRWRVRAAAAAGLGATGRAAAVPPLLDALGRAEGRDRDDVREALRALTGRSMPAAEAPWRAWWEAEGATFRGRNDAPAAAGAAPRRGPGGDDAPAEGADGGVSFYGIQTHSKRVLFVLDVSGSMNFVGSARDGSRKKADVLYEELDRAVRSLPDGAIFNLVAFSSAVTVWRPEPQVRSAKTASAASEWLRKRDVIGATNIHDALETAFRLMGAGGAKDRSAEPAYDTVFFMTDGKPTNGKVVEPDRILAEVRRWNEARRVRIHVVGMGGHEKANGDEPAPEDDFDPAFLRRLAQENGGQCVLR